MLAGLNAQVAPVGSPEHESATAVLNPKFAIELTVDMAELPGVNGEGDGTVADIVKSEVVLKRTPSPLRRLLALPQAKTISTRPSPLMSTNRSLEVAIYQMDGSLIRGGERAVAIPNRDPVCNR